MFIVRPISALRVLPLCLLLACGPTSKPDDTGQPAPPDPIPYLLDDQGRVIIHRGMNVTGAAKWTEGYVPELSDESLALMVANGATFARVLTFWDAVEPQEAAYDTDYLARLDDFLGRLDEAGLSVMLDMHQDLWGVGFGADGAPEWACDSANYDSYDPPEGSWYLGYLTDEVQACFDDYWADPDLQERFAQAWAQVAAVGMGHPSVVGYDVLNEPFWGTSTQDEFEEVLLPAFYERVLAAIRGVDSDPCDFGGWQRPCRFVALEPSTHANIIPSKLLFPADDALVFAPHYYPTYAEEGTGFDGDLEAEAAHLTDILDHGQEAGIPVLLGEYGIFSAQGNEHDYVKGIQDLFESRGASTAYWSWDANDTYGVVTSADEAGYMLGAFQRPYLHRIPAADLSIQSLEDGMTASFTAALGDQVVAVVPEPCGSGVTVQGAQVVAQEGVLWTLDPESSGAVEVGVWGCGGR